MSAETDARAAREALDPLLAANAWRLPDGFADAVERYVALLLDANARLNLTRVVAPDAVARLHLLDALAAVPILDDLTPRRALDLGTGGGVPGLVLALARPSIAWTLVDSVRKKADAVRDFAAELGLTNVDVVAERAELLGRDPAHREAYDLVAARACAALPVLAEYALPLLGVNGSLLAWKGLIPPEELADGAAAAALLGGGAPEVQSTGEAALGDHRFVLVRKQRPTPTRFPRRPGDPARRPLPADPSA
ncbi:MAG: 16S rRNA (guanine(527)-N(7))-methyltransferase RsmG [Chloroflexota bacterium]|nr:16S rRNA (guanine(527)-N(7))-methyltransferase RsmG [Chloroflexota bacterium]